MAARSPLSLGQKDDRRKQSYLHVSFWYSLSSPPVTKLDRSTIPALQTRFQLKVATVEISTDSTFDAALEMWPKMRSLHNRLLNDEDKGFGLERDYLYLLRATLAIRHAGTTVLRAYYLFATPRPSTYATLDDRPVRFSSNEYYASLKSHGDWGKRLRESLGENLVNINSQNWTTRLIGNDCGFSDRQLSNRTVARKGHGSISFLRFCDFAISRFFT